MLKSDHFDISRSTIMRSKLTIIIFMIVNSHARLILEKAKLEKVANGALVGIQF